MPPQQQPSVAVGVGPYDQGPAVTDVEKVSEAELRSSDHEGLAAGEIGRADAGQQAQSLARKLEMLGRDYTWRSQWYPLAFTCNVPLGAIKRYMFMRSNTVS